MCVYSLSRHTLRFNLNSRSANVLTLNSVLNFGQSVLYSEMTVALLKEEREENNLVKSLTERRLGSIM